MLNNKTFIAIIPARSGSKGVPNKNIKTLNSKPLLAWSIDVGLKSKYIDTVIVSTDSKEYADIALDYGAKVPFIRPYEFATDEAPRKNVIKHALDYFKDINKIYDYIVFLEPTSPLRTTNDIDLAIEQLIANDKAESIVSISLSEASHPDFLIKLNGGLFQFLKKSQQSQVVRRQDLEDLYFYDGSLYISEVDKYLEKEFYHENTLGFIVPKWKSLEIDDIEDFVMIEAIMKHKGY